MDLLRDRRIAAGRVDQLRDDNIKRTPVLARMAQEDCYEALWAIMASHRLRCYLRAWQLRARIYTSDLPELVDITTGWPD